MGDLGCKITGTVPSRPSNVDLCFQIIPYLTRVTRYLILNIWGLKKNRKVNKKEGKNRKRRDDEN